MNKSRQLLWVIVVVLVVLGGYYLSQRGSTPGGVPETGPVKIGGFAPLTGEAAAYGLPDQKATDLAVAQINAAGGVNGRRLQVIWEDSKCNGTDATTAVQKLLNIDKVKVVFGLCSGEVLAAAQLTQSARVLLLSAWATSPDITNAGDLVFRTYPSDAFAGKVMADYAVTKLGAKKAAVISENTDFAQGLRKVFVQSIKDSGNTVVFDEPFNTGEMDFRTLVTKLKAADPDVIYVDPQTLSAAELILRQLKTAGVKVPVLGNDPMLDRKAVAENPSLFEGIVLPEVAPDESNPITAAFFKAYKEKTGNDPEYSGYIASSRDLMNLLADAMNATESADPEKIADYFNTNVNDWKGALGTFNFDENGDAVLGLNLRKITGGKVTDLGPYELK